MMEIKEGLVENLVEVVVIISCYAPSVGVPVSMWQLLYLVQGNNKNN